MNVILYANGSSENHGCEAINLTCVKMLEKYFDKIYIATLNRKCEHIFAQRSNVQLVEYHYDGKPSFVNKVRRKLGIKYKSVPWFSQIENILNDIDLAISVGGDNYCYNNNEWLYSCHRLFVDKNIPTVLLGCSIDSVDSEMIEDLKSYDLIIARENFTYNLLKKNLCKVEYLPDPAFSLDIKEDESLYIDENKNYIGINMSPLLYSYVDDPNVVEKNYETLIEYILKNTSYDIMLIPHVVFKNKYGDIEPLCKIFNKYRDERIQIIPYDDARIIKYYISKCKILIAARTHASIAAYSTNVPTIVLGYSVKSRGIATDLFGSDKNYVIKLDDLKNETVLLETFLWVEENYKLIRNKLIEKNIDLIPKSQQYADVIWNELRLGKNENKEI